MLNQGEIKYVFNEPFLQVGDILLMNTYHEHLRKRMGCVYDHAAIYLGDAFIIEADGLGVNMSHIYSYGFKEKDHACVLRLKNASLKVKQEIAMRARMEMGKEYDTREALSVRNHKDAPETEARSNKTFCSRLVAISYNSQGFNIVKNPHYCEPDDFLNSDLLLVVPNSAQQVSDEFLPIIMKKQYERENPNTLLQEAFDAYGKLYGSPIQTMGDLLLEVIRHPELDDDAIRTLDVEPNYFHTTGAVKRSWPWFDNDEEFKAHFNSVDDRLFFIGNQFLHYDNTYLPNISRNVITLVIMCMYFPNSKMLRRIKESFIALYDESMRVRKRLTHLYVETFEEDMDAFNSFAERYGFYHNLEYHEVIDVGFIVDVALKYGFPSGVYTENH